MRQLRPSRLVLVSSLVTAAGVVSGCGNGRLGTDSDQIQRQSLATPESYLLDDPACQETSGSPSIGAQPIYRWNGDAGSQETYPFNVNGMRTVSSSQIDSTYFAYHQRTTESCVGNSSGTYDCTAGEPEVVSQERYLKLCKANGTYSRDSVEGVTLATIANIEDAASVYKQLDGSTNLKKPLLLVLPNYETASDFTPKSDRGDHTIYSETDNAAFGAVEGDSGDDTLIFIVYPRSAELAKDPRWADVRLWEIPWVMAHEFSHQIFYTHYSNYHSDNDRVRSSNSVHGFDAIGKTDGIWKKEPEFKFPRRNRAPSDLSLTNKARDAGVREALSAVNEGFADLLAAQMLDGRKDHTRKLPCFEKSRDILTSTFADGRAKVLTEEARNEFFSSTSTRPDSEVECATDYQDTHFIGAIFAHGVNEILMAGIAPGADVTQRANLVLAWLNNFNAEREKVSYVSAEDTWILAVKAALKTAQGPTEMLLASQCATAKEIFPVYASELFVDQGAMDGFACAAP